MLFFYRFLCFIFFLEIGFASLPDGNDEENRVYSRGIALRKQGQELLGSIAEREMAFVVLQEAISIFYPLAEKNDERPGFAKAQHNLAHCSFLVGDLPVSLKFFRLAREQGLEASARNLSKFPFMMLLSNELLTHIATFLDIQSLIAFMQTSRRLHHVAHEALPRMNFLSSEGEVLLPGFSSLVFSTPPKSVHVRRLVQSRGRVELHFRDPEHLRGVGKRFPIVESMHLSFVFDPDVETRDEIRAIDAPLRSSLLIHVIADTPLHLTGRLAVCNPIVLPQGSPIGGFDHRGTLLYTSGPILETQEDAETLADTFPVLNDEIITTKTAQALLMLQERREDRRRNPQSYPKFQDLALQSSLLYSPTDVIRIRHRDDFSATPLFYVGQAQVELDRVSEDIPGKFSKKIFLVHPSLNTSGLYFQESVSLDQGFEVSTNGDFFMMGEINLPDHNLALLLHRASGIFGSVRARSISIKSNQIYIGSLGRDYIKPADFISDESWAAFLRWLTAHHL